MDPLHGDALIIEQIRESTNVLADLLDAHDPGLQVPTCGDWTLADLVWHLTEVQVFWAHIIGNRPAGPDSYTPPARPHDAELAVGLRASSEQLAELLLAADPTEQAWSWSTDHTVGFSIRRQIHESLVHSIDGILAAGQRLPDVPPQLAADGIDEMVRVMITGAPSWAGFDPGSSSIELRASDTGDRWLLRAGRVVGTEPVSEREMDLPSYELTDGVAPSAMVEAPALDLLLWMWGRLDDVYVELTPDAETSHAALLRSTILAATQ